MNANDFLLDVCEAQRFWCHDFDELDLFMVPEWELDLTTGVYVGAG